MIDPGDEIQNMRTQGALKTGVPHEIQRLVYGGHQLQDGRFASDYFTGEGSTVALRIRLRGGAWAASEEIASGEIHAQRVGLRAHALYSFTDGRPPSHGYHARARDGAGLLLEARWPEHDAHEDALRPDGAGSPGSSGAAPS